ncbi:MAG: tectonin domain-containing protein [Bryobacteraceae bacterium]
MWTNFSRRTFRAHLFAIAALTAVSASAQPVDIAGVFNSSYVPPPAGSINSVFTQVAAGDDFAVALRADGTVFCWGRPGSPGLSMPAGLNNVKAIAAGDQHALALKMDGTVVAWGANDAGQSSVPSGLTGARSIAAGGSHSLAARADGTVAAWGTNLRAESIVPPTAVGIVQVAAGKEHSAALTSDGKLVFWGSNDFGQAPAFEPQRVNIMSVAAGAYHTIYLGKDPVNGRLRAIGRNTEGQIPAVDIPSSTVQSIAGGYFSTLAMMKDGTLRYFGQQMFAPPQQALAASAARNFIATVRPHPWASCRLSGWMKMPGSVAQVSVFRQGKEQADYMVGKTRPGDLSSLGMKDEAWAVSAAPAFPDGNRAIMRYDFSVAGGQWITVPGAAFRIADGPDGAGAKPWVVTKQMGVWQRDLASGWIQQTGQASDIAVAANGDRFVIGFADTTNDNVWQWKNGAWALLPGLAARQIAAEPDGTLWAVGRDYSPYRRENGVWVKKPGSITSIAIGYQSGDVWATDNVPVTDANNQINYGIMVWMGDRWRQESGRAVSLAVANTPWAIQADGTLWAAQTACQ